MKKLKKPFKIILIIIGALLLLFGTLWVVQLRNKNLQDISLIMTNFQRIGTLAESSKVTETRTDGNTLIYRIDNSAMSTDLVLQVDDKWVNQGKEMKVWVATPSNSWTTEQIMSELIPTNWTLELREIGLGPWKFYKDIKMNRRAIYDREELLKQIFGE